MNNKTINKIKRYPRSAWIISISTFAAIAEFQLSKVLHAVSPSMHSEYLEIFTTIGMVLHVYFPVLKVDPSLFSIADPFYPPEQIAHLVIVSFCSSIISISISLAKFKTVHRDFNEYWIERGNNPTRGYIFMILTAIPPSIYYISKVTREYSKPSHVKIFESPSLITEVAFPSFSFFASIVCVFVPILVVEMQKSKYNSKRF